MENKCFQSKNVCNGDTKRKVKSEKKIKNSM